MGSSPDTGTENSECAGDDDGTSTGDKGFNGGQHMAPGFVGARKNNASALASNILVSWMDALRKAAP
jgi:hypothetical protein